jgi:hypothetical protein
LSVTGALGKAERRALPWSKAIRAVSNESALPG